MKKEPDIVPSKSEKTKNKNIEVAMYKVVDHVRIIDKGTGKELLNKRG